MKERFLGFCDCSSARDASGLENVICNFLSSLKLNVPITAESYDGASVMTGKNESLQAKIKKTIYTYRMAHRINLIFQDSCKDNPTAKNFFNAIEALYCHYAKTGNHERQTHT